MGTWNCGCCNTTAQYIETHLDAAAELDRHDDPATIVRGLDDAFSDEGGCGVTVDEMATYLASIDRRCASCGEPAEYRGVTGGGKTGGHWLCLSCGHMVRFHDAPVSTAHHTRCTLPTCWECGSCAECEHSVPGSIDRDWFKAATAETAGDPIERVAFWFSDVMEARCIVDPSTLGVTIGGAPLSQAQINECCQHIDDYAPDYE